MSLRNCRLLFVGAFLGAVLCIEAAIAEERQQLLVYTYHNKPPYYTQMANEEAPDESRTGESPEFFYPYIVNFLNSSQTKWQLTLVHNPRKRLDKILLDQQLKAAVIGVNPKWFADPTEETFLWTGPVMSDRDMVVTRTEHDLSYSHPSDLMGTAMALQRGLFYWGVTPMARAGELDVVETSTDLQNIKLLCQRRVDATIVSEPTLDYFLRHGLTDCSIKPLPIAHDEYSRHMLFTLNAKSAYEDLLPHIATMVDSEDWRRLLAGHRFIADKLSITRVSRF